MPVHFAFTLRLYGHALHCLGNHNFTGLDLFYRIKDCWKGRDDPQDLLMKPLEPGLSGKIGEWCFNTIFDIEVTSESMLKPYFKTLEHEDFVWFLEDVAIAAERSKFFEDDDLVQRIIRQTKEIDELFDQNENAYWQMVNGKGRKRLIQMFSAFCSDRRTSLSRMKVLYAAEVADRILHDRQLCHHIAHTVMQIGFDGETVDGRESQWVARERWPARVKAILRSRDRGKCAACGVDIALELKEEEHIDHMFAIARGGCNDLVNLQILCSRCNQLKSDGLKGVLSSIPAYIRRKPKRRSGS